MGGGIELEQKKEINQPGKAFSQRLPNLLGLSVPISDTNKQTEPTWTRRIQYSAHGACLTLADLDFIFTFHEFQSPCRNDSLSVAQEVRLKHHQVKPYKQKTFLNEPLSSHSQQMNRKCPLSPLQLKLLESPSSNNPPGLRNICHFRILCPSHSSSTA